MNPVRELGGAALLGARAAVAVRRVPGRVFLRELWTQLDQIAVRSAGLVITGMAFFGAVLISIANAQARRFTGNLVVLGPAYFELLVREFGPVTSSLLVAARYGASSAAEISSMSVTEQLDAIRMCAGDPASDVVAPRVLAGAIAVPALCLLGTTAAALSAALTALLAFHVDGWAFLDPRFIDAPDLLSSGAKVLLSGLYIPLVAAVRALPARGGSAAVGRATTQAVVAACLGCLVIDVLVGLAFRVLGL
ncbi:MAG TPA: ABC transporter permease [Myxococcaceae bacterium]|nr:ABC transporter permease [Myxococcaceae bacterium]